MRGLALFLLCLAGPVVAEEPVSGYEFLLPETQALQDDEFANPGMLWVDQGEALWESEGCASCHGDASVSMRGVGAHYPVWSDERGRVVTLDQQINLCRSERLGQDPWAPGSREMTALDAYVMHQSRGLPVAVALDGDEERAAFERGRIYYETPRGQLDLSCANCHVENEGRRLRGEVLSQGQANGFPIYRQLWQDIGSLDRMIRWCHESVRAEPPADGDPVWGDLEFYLRARGNGLVVETPAVRR